MSFVVQTVGSYPVGYYLPLTTQTGISTNNYGLQNGNPDFAFSFWTKLIGTGSLRAAIGLDSPNSNTAFLLLTLGRSTQNPILYYTEGNTVLGTTYPSLKTANIWSHVLVTCTQSISIPDGHNYSVYVNGILTLFHATVYAGSWTPETVGEVYEVFNIGGSFGNSGSYSPTATNTNEIAEVAIWIGNSMGLQEAQQLACGKSPLNINHKSLLSYIPLIDSPKIYGPYQPTLITGSLETYGQPITTVAFKPIWGDHPLVERVPRPKSIMSSTGGGASYLSGISGATSTATSTLTATGALSSTAASSATLSATLAGIVNTTGTIAASSTATSTLNGTGTLSSNLSASTALTATLSGLAPITSTSSAVATLSGTVTGIGALTSTAAEISTLSGTLTNVSASSITGSAAANSTLVSTLTGNGSIVGNLTGYNSLTATLQGILSTSGTSASVASITGTLTGVGNLTSTVSATSALTDTLTGNGALNSTVASISVLTGTLTGIYNITATVAANAQLTGTLSGNTVGGVTGTAASNTSLSGNLTGIGSLTSIVATSSMLNAYFGNQPHQLTTLGTG